MSQLMLDASTKTKLSQSGSNVELIDETGNKFGHFLSPEAYLKLLYEAAKAEVKDEELQKARKEPGGMTTAEVLAHLDKVRRARESRP